MLSFFLIFYRNYIILNIFLHFFIFLSILTYIPSNALSCSSLFLFLCSFPYEYNILILVLSRHQYISLVSHNFYDVPYPLVFVTDTMEVFIHSGHLSIANFVLHRSFPSLWLSFPFPLWWLLINRNYFNVTKWTKHWSFLP